MYTQEVKERAYKLDPECWISYSGKSVEEKRALDVRRTAALDKAREMVEGQEEGIWVRLIISQGTPKFPLQHHKHQSVFPDSRKMGGVECVVLSPEQIEAVAKIIPELERY